MTPSTPSSTPSPLPGGLDVGAALQFAWHHVLVLSLIFLVVAVAVLALLASGKGTSARSEWQEWLDARSAPHREE